MVLHIRAILGACSAASGSLMGGLHLELGTNASRHDDDWTEEMDVLIRHACQSNPLVGEEQPKPDLARIWDELSKRVRGPFGMLAIEGPAFAFEGGPANLSARDGLVPATDFSAPLPAAEEVHSTTVYRGMDCHQMNLR